MNLFKKGDEIIVKSTLQRGVILELVRIKATAAIEAIIKFADGHTLQTNIVNLDFADTQAQADRFNSGKPQLSYMLDFPNAITEHAFICAGGTVKYKKHNWKKGFPFTELEDSLLRHLEKFHNCEDRDVESKRLHLGHVMWNAMTLIEGFSNPETKQQFDNRDHKPTLTNEEK